MEKPNNISGSWGLMIALYGPYFGDDMEPIAIQDIPELIKPTVSDLLINDNVFSIQSATKILQQNRTNNKEYDTEYLVYVPDPDDYVPEFEMEPYARLNFNDK